MEIKAKYLVTTGNLTLTALSLGLIIQGMEYCIAGNTLHRLQTILLP